MGGSRVKGRRRPDHETLNAKRATRVVHKSPKQLSPSKFQKPKHLKRKIESLSSGDVDNPTDKKRLLHELEEFDKVKQQNRTNSAPLTRTQTVTIETPKPQVDSRSNKKQRIQSSGSKSVPSRPDRPSHVDPAFHSAQHDKTSKRSNNTVATPPKPTIVPVAVQVESTHVVKVSSDKKELNASLKVIDQPGSDDEDDADSPTANTRQRGKRRRGRTKATESNTEISIDEKERDVKSDNVVSKLDNTTVPTAGSIREVDETETDSDTQKKRRNFSGDDRRCIGRKPVTDFQIGQSYPGKVVYAKPFGVFLDIGCHSDAFCHVSRLSDDFLESPEAQFPPGTVIEAARVVEVDRSRKRITVSLQSEARLSDEMASITARLDRRNKHGRTSKAPPTPHSRQPAKEDVKKTTVIRPVLDATPVKPSRVKDPVLSTDAGTDLKRERKQARRASRRAEQAQNDVAAE